MIVGKFLPPEEIHMSVNLMIVHPRHTDIEDMRGLFEALPPRMGESVREWCLRTATRLEGNEDSLDALFRAALPYRVFLTSGPISKSVFFRI